MTTMLYSEERDKKIKNLNLFFEILYVIPFKINSSKNSLLETADGVVAPYLESNGQPVDFEKF